MQFTNMDELGLLAQIISVLNVLETLKLRKYPKFPALLKFFTGLPFKFRIEEERKLWWLRKYKRRKGEFEIIEI